MDEQRKSRSRLLTASLALAACGAAACQDQAPTVTDPVALGPQVSRAEAAGRHGVLEIISNGLHFDAPDEIRSGWTTIRFHNRTDAEHFVVLEKLPPGKTLEDSRTEVVPVFQAGMDLLIAGMVPEALAKFGELPAWFFEVVFMGGPGITAPGRTSEVTVELEPGIYVIECYVKTPDGKFHSYLGMIDQIVVTDQPSRARAPRSVAELVVRNGGLELRGRMRPGRQNIAVHFEEQMVHGNFLGSDVHLVRLGEGTELAALNAWMNWAAPAGLSTPAPAEFLGGLHEMPPGYTGYIEVLLKPGRYAWIAEVDDPVGKNMFIPFSIPGKF